MSSRFDRILTAVAPGWAFSRARARARIAAHEFVLRHYEAAARTDRTSRWNRARGDAPTVMWHGISDVRAIARDLCRNNAYARRGVRSIANHTVGWGITPKAVPTNQRAMDAWRAWAETTACDSEGRTDFSGLQKLVVRSVAESGECLIRRRWRTRPEDADLPLPVQLQILEADYIDNDKLESLPNGGRIVNGVEFDAIGQRVAYWLFPEHPGSSMFGSALSSKRVPAEGVAHIYLQERPGQVRGMSWLASIIVLLKDFDQYIDAQLLKQKIAAYLTAIVTDPSGDMGASGLGVQSDQDVTRPQVDSLKPGAVLYPPLGSSVQVVQPPQVRELGDYASIMLHNIASGLGTTYEDMSGDYSEVNFSSARMSRLSHWDDVHDWQYQMLIPQFCDQAWEWAMRAAAVQGKLGTAELMALPRAQWTPPPIPMIEPDKEGIAYMRNVRAGIMSQAEAIRERGYDPDELLAEVAEFNAKLDKLGIVWDSDPRRMTQAGQAQQVGGGQTPAAAAASEPAAGGQGA